MLVVMLLRAGQQMMAPPSYITMIDRSGGRTGQVCLCSIWQGFDICATDTFLSSDSYFGVGAPSLALKVG